MKNLLSLALVPALALAMISYVLACPPDPDPIPVPEPPPEPVSNLIVSQNIEEYNDFSIYVSCTSPLSGTHHYGISVSNCPPVGENNWQALAGGTFEGTVTDWHRSVLFSIPYGGYNGVLPDTIHKFKLIIYNEDWDVEVSKTFYFGAI